MEKDNCLNQILKPEQVDVLYIQMELASGYSLRDFLTTRRDISSTESFRLFGHLLDGLAHIHEHGIVHGDLNPSNVLLVDGVVKISDFGLAKYVSFPGAGEGGRGNCGLGMTPGIGTVLYAAPEQLWPAEVSGDQPVRIFSTLAGCDSSFVVPLTPPILSSMMQR